MTELTYEQVREARAVVCELVSLMYREHGAVAEMAGLVEAKRQLGIQVSLRWPEHFEALLEEQG